MNLQKNPSDPSNFMLNYVCKKVFTLVKVSITKICHDDRALWKTYNKQLLYFLFIVLSFGLLPF